MMKTLMITLLATLTFTIASAQKKVETVRIQTSAVCDMCKETIEKQLAFTKGVTEANVDVATAVATVSYKAHKTSISDIRKAINEVGYDADDSPAIDKAYENLHHCCKKDSR